jgi:hypothetical protein
VNRRGFLRLLGVGTAGLAVDPERLLWTPGARTFFDIQRPVAPRLSISQIVAIQYEKVLAEYRHTPNYWSDHAILRQLERDGLLVRRSDIEIPLEFAS